MDRNLIMYSGTNFPELNDKVFEGFECDLRTYYVKIWNGDKPVNLCKDNIVNVNFKPGDKVRFSYGNNIKVFSYHNVYIVEKCSLDEDVQMLKIEGIDGMYPNSIFTLYEEVEDKLKGGLDASVYRDIFDVKTELHSVDSIAEDVLKALDRMKDNYNNKTNETSFEIIIKEMNELYKVKNANYGDSFSKQFKEYGLTSSCIRLEDKLNRLKSLNKASSDGTKDESVRDTLIDLANYAVLTIMELDKGNKDEDKINR